MIIHHTATADTTIEKMKESMGRHPLWIRAHYIVDNNGGWENVRELNLNAYSTKNGDYNQRAIQIEVIWNYTKVWPSKFALNRIHRLYTKLNEKYPWIKIIGHRDVPWYRWRCPGKSFDLKDIKVYKDPEIMSFIIHPEWHLTFNRDQKQVLRTIWLEANINNLINYAYAKGKSLDFVRTIDAENQTREHKLQSNVKNDWKREESFWLCQLWRERHHKFIKSELFEDPYNQVDYCRDVRLDAKKKGTMPFHAYKYRNERGANIDFRDKEI